MAQQPKILILEDDGLVASSLRDLLSLTGCEVAGVAASVNEALSLAQNTRPDLALIDVRLAGPADGIDGAELLHHRFGIPVIFLTATSTRRRLEGRPESAPT